MRKYDRLAKCSISGDRVVLNYENGENVSLVVRDIASVSSREVDAPIPFGCIVCIVLMVLSAVLTKYLLIDLYLPFKVLFWVIAIWGVIWGSKEKRDGVILETTGGNQIFFCLKKGAGGKEIVNQILDKKSFPNSVDIRAPSQGLFKCHQQRLGVSDVFIDKCVTVGQRISIGQDLGVIEFFGTRHKIESGVAGKVVKVLVEFERYVESDQPLFLIQLDEIVK
jgi:hypothetical protein